MSTKADIQQSKLRFTKWSRKSYAAFLTIGKEVTIGFLAIQLCLRLGLKSVANSLSQIVTLFTKTEEEELPDENSTLLCGFSILLILSGLQPQPNFDVSSERFKSAEVFFSQCDLSFLFSSLTKIFFSLSLELDFKSLFIKPFKSHEQKLPMGSHCCVFF